MNDYSTLEYHDGKVYASLSVMRRIARHTGLRSNSNRKIKKRFKMTIINLLKNYVKKD